MLRITDIKMDIDDDIIKLKRKVSKILGISESRFKTFRIVKKSIDARNKEELKHIYSVDVSLSNEKRFLKIKNVSIVETFKYNVEPLKRRIKYAPVVVGSGPAGLFAALILATAGCKPIVLERGNDVEQRTKDVNAFWENRKLNEDSNVQFGEGGAGTFSDGKLTTNTKDFRIGKVIKEFLEAGAPKEISYVAKPHIGTDNLKIVVKNMREKIISLGGEFRFGHKLVSFEEEDNKIKEITVEAKGERYTLNTDKIILAIGHSARDTFELLKDKNVLIEPKSFAVGVRIEHHQSFINKRQYGLTSDSKNLGAADYKMNAHLENGRGMYTFCMCPGGAVVGASSEKNTVVTNGMSYFSRDMENANSAVLVSVNPSDYLKDDENPLAGVEFQRNLERKAFEFGGENYNAPFQLVGDFLQNKSSREFRTVIPSYLPGVKGCDFRDILNDFVCDGLKEGIMLLNRKLRGFASLDAVLTGVETRSSSPITIKRDNETFQSSIKGLFPCGEGAGYAGGIVSAAVDGIKCAEKCLESYN